MSSDVLIETTVVKAEPKPLTFPAVAEKIAAAAEKYKALTIAGINDRKGLAAVHEARMEVRNARIDVEKTREDLKAESLAYGKRVDAEAKRLTALLAPIEADLVAKEAAIEAEKKRIESAEREAKEKRLRDRLIALQAVQSIAMPSKIEAMTDDEFAAHLGAETAAFELRQAELAAIEAEKQAAEAERQRKLAEEEQARLDALKPVRDKLNAYSDAVAAVEPPDVDADLKERIVEARMAFSLTVEGLAN